VTGYDTDDQLTHLSFDAGHISLPGHIGQIGQSIRLRIPAQDIILAGAAPVAISARNVLPVTITALEQGRGPGVAVGLQAGQARLLARITKASLREMNLSVGDQVFAIIKATAVAPENVGR
jgi:molybdate transport system ATP-binding protein